MDILGQIRQIIDVVFRVRNPNDNNIYEIKIKGADGTLNPNDPDGNPNAIPPAKNIEIQISDAETTFSDPAGSFSKQVMTTDINPQKFSNKEIDVSSSSDDNNTITNIETDSITDGAITTDKLADDSVTGAKINNGLIGPGLAQLTLDGPLQVLVDSTLTVDDRVRVRDGGITAAKLADDNVTKEKINSDVAGNGLGQNADGSLEININPSSSLEIAPFGFPATEALQIKDGGITNDKIMDFAVSGNKISATVAGSGLSKNNVNNTFEVNVDNDTLEIDTLTDTLQVKQNGITANEIQPDAVDSLRIRTDAVTTDKIEDGNVTDDKIATMTATKLTGTIDDARLSTNVNLLNANQIVTGQKTLDVTNLNIGTAINNNNSPTLALPDKTIIPLTGTPTVTDIETLTATGIANGRIVLLRNDTTATFVIKSTGNIAITNYIELAPEATIMFCYDGTNWDVVGSQAFSSWSTSVVSASLTAANYNEIITDGTANITITLPNPAIVGTRIRVIDGGGANNWSVNNVTVTTSLAAQEINFDPSDLNLDVAGGWVELVSNGTGWLVLST